MPFFEPPDPPEEDDEVDEEWDEPTVLHLGGVVPIEAVLARSEFAAVVVRNVVAYPEGFELHVASMIRSWPDEFKSRRRHRMFSHPHDIYDDEELRPTFLRFGIEFPGGARVTNLEPGWAMSPDATEPQHGLESRSGGGGDTRYEQEYWAWPIPDPGTIAFVCEWPAFAIAETRLELDADIIRAAADRAKPVWPDAGAPSHLTRAGMMRHARMRHFGRMSAFSIADEDPEDES